MSSTVILPGGHPGGAVINPKTNKPATFIKTEEIVKKEPKKKSKPESESEEEEYKGFELFKRQKRAEVKAENPDASFKEITEMLKEWWDTLDDDEKDTYN